MTSDNKKRQFVESPLSSKQLKFSLEIYFWIFTKFLQIYYMKNFIRWLQNYVKNFLLLLADTQLIIISYKCWYVIKCLTEYFLIVIYYSYCTLSKSAGSKKNAKLSWLFKTPLYLFVSIYVLCVHEYTVIQNEWGKNLNIFKLWI